MTAPGSGAPRLAGRHMAVVNWRDLGHSLSGGSERYAWEYAEALRDEGARVDFVTARDHGQSRGEVVDGIRVIRRGGALSFYLFAAWYLLTHRRTLDAVVDPECGIPTFSPLFLRRRTAVVLVVHHVHMQQFRTYFPAPVARFGQWLESWVMPRVYRNAATVAVSPSTQEEMVRQLSWTGEIGLLANGSVEPDWSCDPLSKQPHRVVVLGRLVPHKRVDLVVRAVGELAEEFPELRLDVVGRGPQADDLTALVEQLGLAGRVQVHGFLAEEAKGDLLRAASLHVCASDVEGWGQVVIEAAAHGVPTIARDVPGLRDSIRVGETGWLVPDDGEGPEDVLAALVDRLRRSLREVESPQTRRAHRTACLHWAAQFSWSRMRREGVGLVTQEMERRNPASMHKELVATW